MNVSDELAATAMFSKNSTSVTGDKTSIVSIHATDGSSADSKGSITENKVAILSIL